MLSIKNPKQRGTLLKTLALFEFYKIFPSLSPIGNFITMLTWVHWGPSPEILIKPNAWKRIKLNLLSWNNHSPKWHFIKIYYINTKYARNKLFVYLQKKNITHGLYFMQKNNFRFTKETNYIKVHVKCSNFEIIFSACKEPMICI